MDSIDTGEITFAKLTAQYINDPSSWRVYASHGLVADCRPEDWCNDEIDFRDRKAGQLLLEHIAELHEAFDEPIEGEMVKNDQGVTKDVPDTSLECGAPSDTGGGATSDKILVLIQDLLDLADVQGPNEEIVAALDELQTMYRVAKRQEVADLVQRFEIQASAGHDVTSLLNDIDRLITVASEDEKQPGIDFCKHCGSEQLFDAFWKGKEQFADDSPGSRYRTNCTDCGKFQDTAAKKSKKPKLK